MNVKATRRFIARNLAFGLVALLAAAGSLIAISAVDPEGLWVRIGMLLIAVGLAIWLPGKFVLPLTLAIWLVAAVSRLSAADWRLEEPWPFTELPVLLTVALLTLHVRERLRDPDLSARLNNLPHLPQLTQELAPGHGLSEGNDLPSAVEYEIARARRFGRGFSLVLVGVGDMRLRFDFRDEADWHQGFQATADLLSTTRKYVDRVFRHGEHGFALLLPESGPEQVLGLIARLNRETGLGQERPSALPVHYGATFYPECAATAADLLRRAEVALRLAERAPNRLHLDGAEAPPAPPPESLRGPAAASLTEEAPARVLPFTAQVPDAPVPGSTSSLAAELESEDEFDIMLTALDDLTIHLKATLALIEFLKRRIEGPPGPGQAASAG